MDKHGHVQPQHIAVPTKVIESSLWRWKGRVVVEYLESVCARSQMMGNVWYQAQRTIGPCPFND